MAKVVKIPDLVYERMSDEAKKADVSRGAIVREWMQKSDAHDSALFKNNIENGDMVNTYLKDLIDDLHEQADHARTSEDIPDEYAQMQEELANKLGQFCR
ncbi:hypothetical protein 7865G3C7_27 [Haloquadratum phage sp.]|jgi:hypothetical protein|nr:hypothetical protein 7865G3C7_27 [Haloquadratum phage sp.]